MSTAILSTLLVCTRSFFFNDTPTTEIYTLSLHDALPIWDRRDPRAGGDRHGTRAPGSAGQDRRSRPGDRAADRDRKSTRLNSSHVAISYAVFCLKKKKQKESINHRHIQWTG